MHKPEDLPPYLILGELDVDSLNISASEWSAIWQGANLARNTLPPSWPPFGLKYMLGNDVLLR